MEVEHAHKIEALIYPYVPDASYTVECKNNKKRGTATITVKGKGNFQGTKIVKFKIKQGDIVMRIGNRFLPILLAVSLTICLSPGVALGAQGLQSATSPRISAASTSAGYSVAVRDLGLQATGVWNESGYVRITNSTAAGTQRALADKDGHLLFGYESGVDTFKVTDGVVTKYVDPTYGNVSAGKAGHFTLDGKPLYDASYDFVYPYSEGFAVAVNVAKEGRDSADVGLFLLDKQGNRTLSLGGPFATARDFNKTINGIAQTSAFLAGPHSQAMMRNGLIPYYIWGDRSPAVGDDLSTAQVDAASAEREYHGYMDKSGKVVIAGDYTWAANFSKGGLTVVADSKRYVSSDPYYFIDTAGKVVIGSHDGYFGSGYSYSSGFSDAGLAGVGALVKVPKDQADPNYGSDGDGNGFAEKYGYIDEKGETVIPFKYESAWGAGEYNLCGVGATGTDGSLKYGLVTTSDEVVVPLEWDDLTLVEDGVAYGVKAGKLYALDIAPASPVDVERSTVHKISSADVTNVKSKTYTGKALAQSPTVKVGGKVLKAGTDYTLSYSNNVKAGTATMTIKGKGSYTGTKQVKFTIAKANMKGATTAKVKAQKYKKGKAVKPNPKLTFKGKRLKKGTDYTLKYKNNKKRGTATITVKGKGNFKGSKTVKFKIR